MRMPPHPTHPLASEQPRAYLAPSLAPSLPPAPNTTTTGRRQIPPPPAAGFGQVCHHCSSALLGLGLGLG